MECIIHEPLKNNLLKDLTARCLIMKLLNTCGCSSSEEIFLVFLLKFKSEIQVASQWHKCVFLVSMSSQDIGECTGPQSELTELNAGVKKSFLNLRLRIQVRNTVNILSQNLTKASALTICTSLENFCYFVSLTGLRADGYGAGQRVGPISSAKSGRGTQKTDAGVTC